MARSRGSRHCHQPRFRDGPVAQHSSAALQVFGITDLPEIEPGADLAHLLAQSHPFEDSDVLIVAQKVVSKAEGRLVKLVSVEPGELALSLALQTDKDPRVVQLVLDESRRVVRAAKGVLIVEDKRGWVCANAGIDRSNIPQEGESEQVALLPLDPDASAEAIRARIESETGKHIGVVISDSHGRAWREGTVGVCIGAAGISALDDRRGRPDRYGYTLQHTLVGAGDELASAASLLMGQGDESVPAVVIRGLHLLGSGKAADLQRPQERDLFR